MFLILCSSSDVPALWASHGLQAMGLHPISLVTPEILSSAIKLEHRVGNDGASISFKFMDGYGISDHNIRGVLNRLPGPPQGLINRFALADRDYALQEMTAFYLSWLNSLACPMLNRPTPQGLAGRWFHTSELVMLAHQSGLATPIYRQSGSDGAEAGYKPLAPPQARIERVIVLEDEVFGAHPPTPVREGCSKLAKLCRTRLLGIDFFITSGGLWTFSHATPLPDFQVGGTKLLERLTQIFQSGGIQ